MFVALAHTWLGCSAGPLGAPPIETSSSNGPEGLTMKTAPSTPAPATPANLCAGGGVARGRVRAYTFAELVLE